MPYPDDLALPAAAVDTETLFTMHSGEGHVPATNRILTTLSSVITRLGTGASGGAPAANTVYGSTGAGTSTWRKATEADLSFTMSTFSGIQIFQGGLIATTVTLARQVTLGKLVFIWTILQATAAGAAGNSINLSIPSTHAIATPGGQRVLGSVQYVDSPTTVRIGVAIGVSAQLIAIQCDAKTNVLGTAADPLTVASGDLLSAQLCYELA